jgi:hypothetical protein
MTEPFGKDSPANRDCLAKARPGEPMFIILGRDPDGATIVKLWADRRAAAGDPDHAAGVYALADAMREYAADPKNAPESAPDAAAYPPADDRGEALRAENARLRADLARALEAARLYETIFTERGRVRLYSEALLARVKRARAALAMREGE